MKKVQLKDVCVKATSKYAQKDLKEKEGKFAIYGASGLIKYIDEFECAEEYVAVVKDGAGVGRTLFLPAETSVIGTLQYLLPKDNIVPKYLYYAVKNMHLEKYRTGATIPHIYFKDYQNERFQLLDKEEQMKVVRRLDKLEMVLQKKDEQLKNMESLIKSRFIEMFIGKGYPTKTVDEVSLGKGEYGAQSASIEYDPNRPRYVRITDIKDDGTLNDDRVASINPDDDEQYRLEYGDFMFARMGATVGKTYAFITGNQIFAGYLIRYRLNLKLINPRYLFWYTKLDDYWDWVKLNQSGAAQPGINAKKYGSLRIPIPPIELQQQFANFVVQVDKSKFSCYTSNSYN